MSEVLDRKLQRHLRRARVLKWLKGQSWVTLKFWGAAKRVCSWGLLESHLDEKEVQDMEIFLDYDPDPDCPHVWIWFEGDLMERSDRHE